MKEIKFERELKLLLNKIRAYGIQHMQYKDCNKIIKDKEKYKEFVQKVHKGFYLAQKDCILLLSQVLKEKKKYKAELKNARQEHNKIKSSQINDELRYIKYQEMCIRKIMDSIAWQIFNYDLTTMRRLFYGQELIDITDSNLDSEIRFVERFMDNKKESFVLINDLTSFIQVGDVITFSHEEGVGLVELKEGTVNDKVFELIDEFATTDCLYKSYQKLENETDKFKEQFWRDVKQIKRNTQVMSTINNGEGIDLLSNKEIKICKDEIVLDTYSEIVEQLLDECDKKGHSISVVEGCMLIGVYKTGKVSSNMFDIWAKSLDINMPIVDFRQSMFDPLAYPIFLQPFSDKHIMDIVMGRKIVKLTIDIEKWLEIFKEDNLSYRWLSKKETARANNEAKGKIGIFNLDGRAVEICDERGITQQIGEGIFSRMFTHLNTPSSLKKLLKSIIQKVDEDEWKGREIKKDNV